MRSKKSRTFAGAPAGSGKNFKKLSEKLDKEGAEDSDALAAYIGRKKYGNKKFQKMAANGRKGK